MIYPWETCANPECGKSFLKTMPQLKYCSNLCRTTFHWQRFKSTATTEDRLLKKGLNREWRLQHPATLRVNRADRRLRLRAAPGSHTKAEWLIRVDELGWNCFYCRMPLHVETLTKDHFIPLAKGGSNSVENLVPACIACNLSKGDRLPDAFKKENLENPKKKSSNTRSGGNPPKMTELAMQVMRNKKLRARRTCVKPSGKHTVLPSRLDVEVVETMGLSFTYPDLSGQSHSTRTRFPRNYPQDGGK
jgi:hypothetical protein